MIKLTSVEYLKDLLWHILCLLKILEHHITGQVQKYLKKMVQNGLQTDSDPGEMEETGEGELSRPEL